jgi:hypothetical protein
MKSGIIYYSIAIVLAFGLGGVLGEFAQSREMQKQIILHSCGTYDSITGNFIWLSP